MTEVAILSALYGPYEWAKPVPLDLGVPALMMTDDPDLDAPGWMVKVVTDHLEDVTWTDPAATVDMMRHKYWKCYPSWAFTYAGMDEPDVVIWLDASMTITEPEFVKKCLEVLGDDDWSVTRHPWRTCVYDEATFSGHLSRYHRPSLEAQAAFYRAIGHPANWGLFATGASIRRMTNTVEELGDQWWWECITRTHQDQVSLPVLFRLAEDRLKWNANMPWWTWWDLGQHGR